jgi:hypothetical protein
MTSAPRRRTTRSADHLVDVTNACESSEDNPAQALLDGDWPGEEEDEDE